MSYLNRVIAALLHTFLPFIGIILVSAFTDISKKVFWDILTSIVWIGGIFFILAYFVDDLFGLYYASNFGFFGYLWSSFFYSLKKYPSK